MVSLAFSLSLSRHYTTTMQTPPSEVEIGGDCIVIGVVGVPDRENELVGSQLVPPIAGGVLGFSCWSDKVKLDEKENEADVIKRERDVNAPCEPLSPWSPPLPAPKPWALEKFNIGSHFFVPKWCCCIMND